MGEDHRDPAYAITAPARPTAAGGGARRARGRRSGRGPCPAGTGRARRGPASRDRRAASAAGSSNSPRWSAIRLPSGLAGTSRQPGGGERGEGVLGPEAEDLERHRRVQRLDELVRGGDDDEAPRRGGDDLLARVGGAAALDEPAGGVDLVGPVDRDVQLAEGVERLDVESERPGGLLGGRRRGRAAQGQAALGERREQEGDRQPVPRPTRAPSGTSRAAARAAASFRASMVAWLTAARGRRTWAPSAPSG